MTLSRLIAVTLFCLIALPTLTWAEDTTVTGWQQSMTADLTATQTVYSDSWAGGEAGSFSWVGNLNGTAEKQMSPKLNFRSVLKVSFGQTLSQNAETKSWSKPTKSTDLIDWENLARFTLGKFLDPYAAVRLETQFLDASVPQKKRTLSPLKLTESVGLAREFYKKDKDLLLSRFGLAIRQTFTKEITDLVLLTTSTESATDGGLESVTDASFKLSERLQYNGKLTLYKAFFFSKEDDFKGTPQADYWKAVDINWENIVNASISKIVSVNLYAQLLYDKEISKRGRFKETMGIGFVFKLI